MAQEAGDDQHLLGVGDDRVLDRAAETIGSGQEGPPGKDLLDDGLRPAGFIANFRVAKPHLIADDDGGVRKLVEGFAHDAEPLAGGMIDLAKK